MAPAVAGTKREEPAPLPPARMREMFRRAAREVRHKVLSEFDDVGPRFAAEARAIHDGDRPHAVIHGQATPAEARALADDGIAVAPLLVPVVPPDERN